MTRISDHTIERISGRLNGIVTKADIAIATAAAKKFETEEKIYVGIRRFGRMISIDEAGYEKVDTGNGTGINGNCLVAVIKRGEIKTLMVAKEENDWYFKRDSARGLVFVRLVTR